MKNQRVWTSRFASTLFLSLFTLMAYAQGLKGKITDQATGEPIIGAAVAVADGTSGTITNVNGEYNLKLKPGSYRIKFSFVGYTPQTQSVTVSNEVQTLDVALEEAVTNLTDLVVVGSRSAQIRSNIETPAPIDVMLMKDMQTTGQIELTQMINMVAPSFNSSRQTVADGTDHIDPATIRGLGPDQVLVLLNGKRRHNQALTNVNGTIGRGSVGTDLNTIPVAAIERIEVLRDGAASQYGSDAIAGVINVVMKKDAGTSASLHVGQQYEGDGSNLNLGIYHGLKMGKRGGTISFSTDIRFREATNRAGDYTGPVYRNWNAITNLEQRQAAWEEDQRLIRENNFNLSDNMLIGNSAVNNYAGMINGNLPISAKTTFYFTSILNYRNGQAAGFYRYPFQTAQVNAALYPNGFLPQIHSSILDRSLLAGLSGEFGNGWRWDLSNVYGGNAFRFDVKGSNNASQFALGASAPTDFYAGTLRFNQNTSDFTLSKDFGDKMGLKSFNIATGANFRIDNYQIEAGEEASWRNFDPTSGRVGGAQVFPGFQPSNEVNENRTVAGAFLDIETDLTDRFLVTTAARFENYSDFGSNLAGKLSARYKFHEAFSIRGAIANGFRAPSINQRFFSAVSTVFISTPDGVVPRQQGTFRNGSAVANAFGVPSLTAERSMNYSFGVTSEIAQNINITVDAYQVDIRDRIILTGQFARGTSATGQQIARILDNAGQTEVNAAVFFTNAINTRTQGIDIVISGNANIGSGTLTTSLAGNFNRTEVQGEPKGSATLPPDQFGNQLFNRAERARIELAQPRSKVTLGFNYRLNNLGANLRFTRFGEVASFDPANPLLDQVFTPKTLTDLSVSYRFARFMQFTIGANNLFDVYPDRLSANQYPTATRLQAQSLDNTSFGRFQYSRAATQFGFNGGYYYAAMSFNF